MNNESATERREKLLDGLAQLAGGAAGLVSGLGQQVQAETKSRVQDLAAELDLVPREDFERLELLLAEILKRQSDLESRIESLEGAKKTKTPKKTPAKKK